MPKDPFAPVVTPDTTAFEIAKRKAKFGRRDWLVFKRRDGAFETRPYSAAAIKAALLAGGSSVRFTWFSAGGISNICRSWSFGVHLFRCARGNERFSAG